jgi:hypothetical protein
MDCRAQELHIPSPKLWSLWQLPCSNNKTPAPIRGIDEAGVNHGRSMQIGFSSAAQHYANRALGQAGQFFSRLLGPACTTAGCILGVLDLYFITSLTSDALTL